MKPANVLRAAILLQALKDTDDVARALGDVEAEGVGQFVGIALAAGVCHAEQGAVPSKGWCQVDVETGVKLIAAARELITHELTALGVSE